MGIAIDRDTFEPADYDRFRSRLRASLEVLPRVLARPGFGSSDADLGVELELSIVDGFGQALPINRELLARSLDGHLTLEIDRFNLEYNLKPVPLQGRPFTAIRNQLQRSVERLDELAAPHGGQVVAVGILPSLTRADLQAHSMTDLPRYRALSRVLRDLRGGPVDITIDGPEPLRTQCDDVTVEGAATSLQVHLRVHPRDFVARYNAAQLITAPVLAACVNSPVFLGHLLWDETRIALFRQAVDARPTGASDWRSPARVCFGNGWSREGPLELFQETVALFPPLLPITSEEEPGVVFDRGATPGLDELRLHLSTVWRWNRPVYDPAGPGHLRIEMRALPSGPTPIDCAANAALMVGLTAGFSGRMQELLPAFPFDYARWNFYHAAQHGLAATLLWPVPGGGTSPREVAVRALLEELVPVAEEGLASLGVDSSEVGALSSVIKARVANGQTGASWQRTALARIERSLPRAEALRELTRQYASRSKHLDPVHTWSAP